MKTKIKKKAFTLVEVLIAVALISIVIGALIQMGQNNLYLLEKFKAISVNNDYSSLSFYGIDETKMSDQKIYLDEVVDFKDDDLRRELKEIKVIVKNEKLDDETIPTDNIVITKQITKTKLTIENQKEKDFYRFKLVY
jgi:prepilin-type N-terminal cleavage/methylation domain-containing protein